MNYSRSTFVIALTLFWSTSIFAESGFKVAIGPTVATTSDDPFQIALESTFMMTGNKVVFPAWASAEIAYGFSSATPRLSVETGLWFFAALGLGVGTTFDDIDAHLHVALPIPVSSFYARDIGDC